MSVTSLGSRRSKAYYTFWKVAFFVSVFAFVCGIYAASQGVEYIWRWYRVPDYIYHLETTEVLAELEGDVTAVVTSGERAVVTIVGTDGAEERYTVPAKSLQVDEGDLISPGDVLGSYTEWKTGMLVEGLWLTMKLSVIAIFLGILLGLFTGLARISTNRLLKWWAVTYIELIRGTPLLVQIFIWYYVLGTLINGLLEKGGFDGLSNEFYGVISLALFAGAYIAEIVRAGIQSIHRGQIEASRSLGMTGAQCMYHVILPQAFKRILPPLAGQFISLVKDSSLLGIIAIRELTKATREAVAVTLQSYEFWIVCALLYLVITFALSMLLQYMEKRMVNA